jgi:hypothetical protein
LISKNSRLNRLNPAAIQSVELESNYEIHSKKIRHQMARVGQQNEQTLTT